MSARSTSQLLIGVDTGGTFTDIVYRDGPRAGTFKLLSTPEDPARAVLAALTHLFGSRRPDAVTYGTTVATNAMLERRGARTALLTTAGFEDVVAIGRQARPSLYDLEPTVPAPLVPAALRIGVKERVLHDGTVETALDGQELVALSRLLRERRVESVAVCFLHSYTNPAHEETAARKLAGLGVPVTLSHELSPEPGEYERTTTTIVNAYVRPKVARHIAALARDSGASTFRVMQSNGGAIGVDTACREPIRTMLSGPAGGVAAAHALAARVGLERIVTFDMGGTSTDVALLDASVPRRAVTVVDGIPVRTPSLDIHTVGAGGGSIAEIDEGGSLKVGPESAGADPGPACYGRGQRPTVTDANLLLGRLRPEAFLGGDMALEPARAERVLGKLARRMGVSAEEAAEGVVRVVEGTMERAIRVITVERGQDPRSCALVAFGGAAALHACGLANELGIADVLVPRDAGLLSAWGVLAGPVIRDRAVALRLTDPSYRQLKATADALVRTAREEVVAEGIVRSRVRAEIFVRMRYLGQSLELEVPLARDLRASFDHEHERLFHTSDAQRSVEACGLRVTATGVLDRPTPRRPPARGAHATRRKPAPRARVYLDGRWRRLPIVERTLLAAGTDGTKIDGPAVVTEYSSTVLVRDGWRLSVDADESLRLRRHG